MTFASTFLLMNTVAHLMMIVMLHSATATSAFLLTVPPSVKPVSSKHQRQHRSINSSSTSKLQATSKVLQLLRGGGSSSSFLETLSGTIAPKVGVVTSTALYLAPAAAVLQAIKNDDMGDLNPLPLAIMSIVSVSWLAYGLAAKNANVALSNIGGCVASIGYVVGILPLLSKNKEQLRMTQKVLLGGTTAVLSLWTFLGLSSSMTASQMAHYLGLFASGLFIFLAGSPLSTISKVVHSKDSSSILGTLTAAQVINTCLWSFYGLAVKDRFVWGPNVIGLVLGLIQLTLKILFPARSVISL
mmetsp:Transcript_197/g.282  ORF Transcript_197/g.282 Transcript_197/m.282 type:complete len:300 (-) Transcript_197:229-1128(-)